MDKEIPTPRFISLEELHAEDARRTIRCSSCGEWIRYYEKDVVTDRARDRRFVPCPCGHERVVALGGIRP